MAHLHLNACFRRNLFNWLSTLVGYDARWRLMRRLAKSWRIKELGRQYDEYQQAQGRAMAVNLKAQATPDEQGHPLDAVALYDLRLAAAKLQQDASSPPFLAADVATEQYQIDESDLEAVWTLTAPLRTEPAKGEGGAKINPPCKTCGLGGTTVAGDYEWLGGICDALTMAYDAMKADKPCAVCKTASASAPAGGVAPASSSDGEVLHELTPPGT